MSHKIGIIGGTDSSGGSGLWADQKTISGLNCEVVSVISAITLQSSSTHISIHPVPKIGLKSQLDSLLEEELSALKIGMLPDLDSINEIARFLDFVKCEKIILDPVQRTSSSHDLISKEDWRILIEKLTPKVQLITPNVKEAVALLELPSDSDINPEKVAKKCLDFGSKYVLLKGGHLSSSNLSTDILASGEKIKTFSYPRLPQGHNKRGTGCRLASAVASEWAKNDHLETAVKFAGKYIQNYIKDSLTT